VFKAQAYVDTETTGLDPNHAEVIEVAIIRVDPDGTETRFETRIKPVNMGWAHPKALAVNGYAEHPELWDDAPTMAEVGPKIIELLDGCILIGQNVSFDEAMLKENLARAGVKGKVTRRRVDVMTLSHEHLVPLGLGSLSMDSVREFLDWPKEGAHRAMKDAEDVMRLHRLLNRMGYLRRLRLRFGLARLRVDRTLLELCEKSWRGPVAE